MNMDNADHMHWGYPTTPTSHHQQWQGMTTRSAMKRAVSESDCEYSEGESSKEQVSPSGGSCQMLNRKKRRGVIEKRRRDKINSSLSDLKRLVPSAYEKQGSAKLEKAEILKLTVDHLKTLHSRRMDSLSHHESQRIAVESHMMGFRECAAEVARYLITIEGMDIQDPLRLRLMSHLEYFAQQREISAKACPTTSPHWSAYQPNCTSPSSYQLYAAPPAPVPQAYPNSAMPVAANPTAVVSHHEPTVTDTHTAQAKSPTINSSHISHHQQQQPHPHPQSPHEQEQQHQIHHQQSFNAESQGYETTTYLELNSRHSSLNYGHPPQYATSSHLQGYPSAGSASQYVGSNGARPYRPWGAEMAY